MGVHDYENMKLDGSLEKVKNNNEFSLFLGNAFIHQDTYGELLNKHCFKFTKIREEMYFIQCSLMNRVEPYETGSFIFLVNKNSFWKRFSIYLKNNPKSPYIDSNNIDIVDFINKINNKRIEIDRIELNLLPIEQEVLNSYNGDKKFIANKSICSFIGVYSYNKRVVAEIFTQSAPGERSWTKYDDQNQAYSINVILGSYKDPESVMYYDPTDPNYQDYRNLYIF
jgi:hypothetical protein